MGSDDNLAVHEATGDHAIGRWRGVVLYVWRGSTTPHGADVLERALADARAVVPEGPGVLLGVVEAGTPPPQSEAKAPLARSLGSGRGYVLASALVFEGQGFAASMVRAVATGLALLARPGFPHQVFGNLPSGAAWLEQQLRAAGKPRYLAPELASMLQKLRATPHTKP